MNTFQKTDMLYDYTWNETREDDNKRVQGFPEDYLLFRNEGFEVLPFIIRYMRARRLDTISAFHTIESAIREGMPKNVIGHQAVRTWLDNNLIGLV